MCFQPPTEWLCFSTLTKHWRKEGLKPTSLLAMAWGFQVSVLGITCCIVTFGAKRWKHIGQGLNTFQCLHSIKHSFSSSLTKIFFLPLHLFNHYLNMFKAGIHIVFQQIHLALRCCVKSQWILFTDVGHFKC